MKVITMDEASFYSLIDEVIEYVRNKTQTPQKRFLTKKEALDKLSVCATTLQKLRDTQAIRVIRLSPRKLLYDAQSINEYINRNAIDPL